MLTIQSTVDLWHARVGHQGAAVLQEVSRQHNLDLGQVAHTPCPVCKLANAHASPVSNKADPQYKATAPIRTLHADLFGPITIVDQARHPRQPSLGGHQYILVVTDEYTHTAFVRLLREKSEATQYIIDLIEQLERDLDRDVIRFHSDRGGEFLAAALKSYFANKRIRHTTSSSGKSPHNGLAERMNRTIQSMMRAFLVQAGAPVSLWGEAALWAAHVYNSTPRQSSGWKPPFQLLFNRQCKARRLKVWGCDAFVRHQENKHSKIQPRAWRGVFVGHDIVTGGYRVLQPGTNRVHLTRDVEFIEGSFSHMRLLVATHLGKAAPQFADLNPFAPLEEQDDSTLSVGSGTDSDPQDSETKQPTRGTSTTGTISCASPDSADRAIHAVIDLSDPDVDVGESLGIQPDSEVGTSDSNDACLEPESDDGAHSSTATPATTTATPATTTATPATTAATPATITATQADTTTTAKPRGKRQTEAEILEAQYASWNNQPEPTDATTRSARGRAITQPNAIANDLDNYAPEDQEDALNRILDTDSEEDEHAFIAYTSTSNSELAFTFDSSALQPEPKTYKDAIQSADAEAWKDAMQQEINSLNKLGVWELVKLPRGAKAIRGKWVFKNKLGAENELLRRKARYVAKGFQQVLGRDYFDTHSPVAQMKSIKMILSFAASADYELMQMDFDTAFLNAEVDADIYMEQPEGFHQGSEDTVCKLKKALYGLKQASRRWFKTINEFMLRMGFKPLVSDACVYRKRSKTGNLIIISLYVDDTIIAVHKNDLAEWNECKSRIADAFATKDLGECKWILNMKVTRNRAQRTITLSQEAYIDRIVSEFGLGETRPITTPAAPVDLNFPADNTDPKALDHKQMENYQSLIGALLYASNITRPDVAYAVGQLCRHTANPYQHHLHAARRIVRYLHQTKAYCLIFGVHPSANFQLVAFSDSDWAGDKATKKSTTGVIIKFSGDTICWLSRRQKVVAQSTAEAEYIALAEATKELLWFRSWVAEMFNKIVTGTIYGDNRSSIDIVKTESLSNRVRHIDIRTHLIRDHYDKGDIELQWIPTDEQDADILTKPLSPPAFLPIRNRIMYECH
jgi:transposase InsO family protein